MKWIIMNRATGDPSCHETGRDGVRRIVLFDTAGDAQQEINDDGFPEEEYPHEVPDDYDTTPKD